MSNKNHYENLRLQISKVTEMAQIGPKFSKAVSVDHLLSLILKQTLDLMKADVCIIWLKDDSGNLVPRISFGLKGRLIQSIKVKCDLLKDNRPPIKRLIKKEGLKSLLDSPLVVGDEQIGVLMICTRESRRFSDVDLKIFDALTKQSALAITNIGLYEKMDKKVKEKTDEITMLFTMSRSLSSSIDLDLMLNLILEKTRILMKARFCDLRLLDNSRKKLTLVSFAGIGRREVNEASQFEDEIASKVLKSNAPCVISDVKTHFKNRIPRHLKKKNIHSLLMVPVFSNKHRSGVLSIYSPEVRIFEREDIELLEMVASICAMAIDNATMLERIRKDYLNTVKTLAKIIDANDSYTRGHCDKVMKYSLQICRRLRLPPGKTDTIKTASLLHDIGKIGIDLNIIRKPGKLSAEDWQKVKLHPDIGARIISQVGFLNDVVTIIKHHHERYAGGGYPDPKKKGPKIPLGSRIIAVADAFDAMTSDRPYRKAMPRQAAVRELKKCAGQQFDPDIVKAFVK